MRPPPKTLKLLHIGIIFPYALLTTSTLKSLLGTTKTSTFPLRMLRALTLNPNSRELSLIEVQLPRECPCLGGRRKLRHGGNTKIPGNSSLRGVVTTRHSYQLPVPSFCVMGQKLLNTGILELNPSKKKINTSMSGLDPGQTVQKNEVASMFLRFHKESTTANGPQLLCTATLLSRFLGSFRPILVPVNIWCRNIIYSQKGPIVLRTAQKARARGALYGRGLGIKAFPFTQAIG